MSSVKRYWTYGEIAVNLPPDDCKFVLASDYSALLAVLRRCVPVMKEATGCLVAKGFSLGEEGGIVKMLYDALVAAREFTEEAKP
jgi:hypothetical protein